MTAEYERLDHLLTTAAGELRAAYRRSAALPLVDLARRHGIDVWVRGTPSQKKFDAHIDLDGSSITLYRTTSKAGSKRVAPDDEAELMPRERFSIAHELGHWLLFHRASHPPHPKDNTEAFWMDERLCHKFANQLLVPDWLADSWLDSVPDGSAVLPRLLRQWAASIRVSPEVAAHALVRRRADVGFVKMSHGSDDGESFFIVKFSSAGSNIHVPGTGSHLRDRDMRNLILSRESGLANLANCRLGRCAEQDLTLRWETNRRSTGTSGNRNLVITWLSVARPRPNQPSLAL